MNTRVSSRFLIVLMVCYLMFVPNFVVSSASEVPTTSLGSENYPTNGIIYPLSTIPVIQLRRKSFVVKVNASSHAAGWNLQLSNYDEIYLKLNSAVHDNSTGLWFLNVTIPSEADDSLYALRVRFKIGEREEIYTQPRSVQVLTSFPSKFRFVHMTDIHIKTWEESARAFKEVISEVNLIHPAFVLISGDLTNYGCNKEAVSLFFDVLQTFAVPTFLCPGNHDHWSQGTENYRRYFGSLYYSIDVGPYHIVSLDSGSADVANLDDLQLGWLEMDLAQHVNSTMRILQLHHPPSSDAKSNSRMLELIDRYNVSAVFTGHTHQNRVWTYKGQKFFTTTAVGDGGGYRLVNVEGNRILSHDFIPQSSIDYGYHPSNNGSSNVMLAKIENAHEQSFENLLLQFNMAKIGDLHGYKVYNGIATKVFETPNAYIFQVAVNVSVRQSLIVAVAQSLDATPPSISSIKIEPSAPLGDDLSVQTKVEDDWWGVGYALLFYTVNREPWTHEYMRLTENFEYEITIPKPESGTDLTFCVATCDLAGNWNHTVPITFRLETPQQPAVATLQYHREITEAENETNQVGDAPTLTSALIAFILGSILAIAITGTWPNYKARVLHI